MRSIFNTDTLWTDTLWKDTLWNDTIWTYISQSHKKKSIVTIYVLKSLTIFSYHESCLSKKKRLQLIYLDDCFITPFRCCSFLTVAAVRSKLLILGNTIFNTDFQLMHYIAISIVNNKTTISK